MIISASRRTDIPAFYSEWFINRIREGYCQVVNPFNSKQYTRISLKPEDTDVIVFWTKNAHPMMEHTDTLDDMEYKYYFQYTLNNYPKVLEPNLPEFGKSVDTFKRLADKIGDNKVIWRYDPIIISDLTPFEYHISKFEAIAQKLKDHTNRAIISVVDEYRAAKGRLSRANIGYDPNPAGTEGFAEMMITIAQTANRSGLEIYSCSELIDLKPYGINPGKCIDDEYIKQAFGTDVNSLKDKNQREECGCVISKDIGEYNTCLHDCQYCYATRSRKESDENYKKHNSSDNSLTCDYVSEQQELFDL